MCHLYPYINVKLLRKFFHINLVISVIEREHLAWFPVCSVGSSVHAYVPHSR